MRYPYKLKRVNRPGVKLFDVLDTKGKKIGEISRGLGRGADRTWTATPIGGKANKASDLRSAADKVAKAWGAADKVVGKGSEPGESEEVREARRSPAGVKRRLRTASHLAGMERTISANLKQPDITKAERVKMQRLLSEVHAMFEELSAGAQAPPARVKRGARK